MSKAPNVDGTAALAICEALLLALADRNVLPDHEIMGVLHDAAESHKGVPSDQDKGGTHAAAAALIEALIDKSVSTRKR